MPEPARIPRRPAARKGRRSLTPPFAIAIVAATLGTPAAAQVPLPTGGTAPGDVPANAAPAASATAPAPSHPVAQVVTCRTACAGIARATPGSTVRVSGDGMSGATTITFLGGKGPRDDISMAASPVGSTAVEATVPRKARSGALRVAAGKQKSLPTKSRLTVVRAGTRAAGGSAVETQVETPRVLPDPTHHASIAVFVRGAPASVAVDVVQAASGQTVFHAELAAAPAGTVQSVAWDGVSAGAAQAEGRYLFRVAGMAAAASSGAVAAPGMAARSAGFTLVRDRFPIVGTYRYGDGLGAGRGHQGQDVFAACGTPLVAAHGGTVQMRDRQSAAGNYLVVDLADSDQDQVYMHLRAPATVAEGDTIVAGEPIGNVGDTGDADGCHLHFEIWSAPGWYEGGHPIDPLPRLKAWDTALG